MERTTGAIHDVKLIVATESQFLYFGKENLDSFCDFFEFLRNADKLRTWKVKYKPQMIC